MTDGGALREIHFPAQGNSGVCKGNQGTPGSCSPPERRVRLGGERKAAGGRFFVFAPCCEALLAGSGFLDCGLLGLGLRALRVLGVGFRVSGLRASGLPKAREQECRACFEQSVSSHEQSMLGNPGIKVPPTP